MCCPKQFASGGTLSKINAFLQRKRIVKVDAKIPYGAVHFGMSEQKLNSEQTARFLESLGKFGAPH